LVSAKDLDLMVPTLPTAPEVASTSPVLSGVGGLCGNWSDLQRAIRTIYPPGSLEAMSQAEGGKAYPWLREEIP